MAQSSKAQAAKATLALIDRLLANPLTAPAALATKIIHTGGVYLALEVAFHIINAVATVHDLDGKPLPPSLAEPVTRAQQLVPAFAAQGFVEPPKPSSD